MVGVLAAAACLSWFSAWNVHAQDTTDPWVVGLASEVYSDTGWTEPSGDFVLIYDGTGRFRLHTDGGFRGAGFLTPGEIERLSGPQLRTLLRTRSSLRGAATEAGRYYAMQVWCPGEVAWTARFTTPTEPVLADWWDRVLEAARDHLGQEAVSPLARPEGRPEFLPWVAQQTEGTECLPQVRLLLYTGARPTEGTCSSWRGQWPDDPGTTHEDPRP